MAKKLLVFLVLSLIPLLVNAESVEINGIYYNLFSDTQTAEVTRNPYGYTGDIIIPSTVLYENVTYTVTTLELGGCRNLISIQIPNTVTKIDGYCFEGAKLKSIVIPKSIISISSQSFCDCTELAQISVEEGNTVYDSRNNCNAIIETKSNTLVKGCKNTVIPNGIRYIGSSAFDRCRNLTSIDIPESVISIGSLAFQATKLTSISLPKSVFSIGWSAFVNCSSLTSVILPRGLKTLSDGAFSRCEALVSIISHTREPIDITENVFTATVYANATLTVPKGSKVLYQGKENWSKFANIVENNEEEPNVDTKKIYNVENAGTLANLINEDEKWFIEELTLTGELNGSDIRIIRELAGCDYAGNRTGGSLKFLDLSNARIVEGGEKYLDTDNISAAGIGGGYRLNTKTDVITKHMFSGCSSLISLILPNNITTIESNGVAYCRNLTTLTIPQSVTTINAWGFCECRSLKSVTIPASVTYIGNRTFLNCSALEEIIVEEGNTYYISVNGVLFNKDMTRLMQYPVGNSATNYSIPNTVKTINELAFNFAKNLTCIGMPEGLERIDYSAFYGCAALTSIDFPNSLRIIGEHSFGSCSELTTVDIPDGVTTIGARGFYGCSKLTSISIPQSVSSIGSNPFSWCDELQEINVSTNNEKYQSLSGVLFDKSLTTVINYPIGKKETEYSIPTSVTTVGSGAFNGAKNLTSIIIPNGVIYINNDGFRNCTSIEAITIPQSVKSIGDYAFYMCDKLTSITSNIAEPFAIPSNTFSFYRDNMTLTVPYGKKAVYESTNGWKNFKTIIEDNSQDSYNTIPEAIDLGLTVKWASWNVGADKPEGLGNLYAWGELSPKTDYSASTYKFYNDSYTKYGSVDNKYRLDSEDDVAQQKWGDKWRMPTFEELKELKEKCTFTETELNGVPVTKVTGPNGNFIYFPYPGNFTGTYLYFKNSIGSYWSSDLESDSYAKDLDFGYSEPSLNGDTRYHGQSIRPVYGDNNDVPHPNGTVPDVVDLGLTSGTLWAAWNIGASTPEEYGTYFAWGETAPKGCYDWSTYKFGDGSNFSKYNSTDGLTELELEDDAAYVILGKDWRMPTHKEELELVNECSWESVTVNGISGYKITGPNGNSIFMPRGGLYDGTDYSCDGTKLSNVNTCGWYWSSTLNAKGSAYAQGLCFFPSLLSNVSDHERCDGHNIRPVYVGYSNDPDPQTVVEVTDVTNMANAIYVEPLRGSAGSDVNIKVKLKNANSVTSYGFELVLPAGVTISTSTDGSFDDAVTMSTRHKGHTLTTNKLANNTYKVGVASLSSKALTDNDGLVLTIKAHAADNIAEGEYAIGVQSPLIVNADGTKPAVQGTQSKITIEDYTKGDVDGDGVIDLADAVLVINHYVGKPVAKFNEKAADVDGDGVIDLADAVRIINFYVGKVQSLAPGLDLDGLDPQ